MFRDHLSVPSSRVRLSKKKAGRQARYYIGKGTLLPQLSSWAVSPLKLGPTGRSETSVSRHLTPRNNPEDGRIRFNRGGSLRSGTVSVLFFVRAATVACETTSYVKTPLKRRPSGNHHLPTQQRLCASLFVWTWLLRCHRKKRRMIQSYSKGINLPPGSAELLTLGHSWSDHEEFNVEFSNRHELRYCCRSTIK